MARQPTTTKSGIISPAVWATWAAAACSMAGNMLQSRRRLELHSEIICWTVLPLVFLASTPTDTRLRAGAGGKHGARTTTTAPQAKGLVQAACSPSSSFSTWSVAACVAASSVCLAEGNHGGALLPVLHPLFSCARTWIRSETAAADSGAVHLSVALQAGLAVLFCVLTVSSIRPYEVLLSGISVAALLGVLIAFTSSPPPPFAPSRFCPHVRLRLPQDVKPLAVRIGTTMCIVAFVRDTFLGPPPGGFISVVGLGIVKCGTWYFTTMAAQLTSWSIAPAIWTCGLLSTRAFLPQPWTAYAVLRTLGGCLLGLHQLLSILSPSSRGRSTLWALLIVALAPVAVDHYAKYAARGGPATDVVYQETHPIERLIQRANERFDAMVQSQSQSYAAAWNEYKRRYKMDPPPGFESWYNFAKAHDSPIVDDFDVLYRGISPFWDMTGGGYAAALEQAQRAQSDLWSCDFSGSSGETTCRHPYRTFDRHIGGLFDTISEDVRQALSNVSFVVNHLDEPRVMFPRQHHHHRTAVPQNQEPLRETDLKHTPTWELLTRDCNWSAGRAPSQSVLPFVENVTDATDLCRHAEYRAMHGLFVSPTSFQLIENRVPILSTGSVSTMNDILLPSPAYLEPGFKYEAATDRDWHKKRSNVYWAGSTTGGYSAGTGTWRHLHRQRFVSLVQNAGGQKQAYHYLQEKDGTFKRHTCSFLDRTLYDVSFTNMMQCERRSCREQDVHFMLKSWAHKDAALGSRLVLDLDGNGISGRFYKLLASKSAPLKQTLFREWHDDRLVPWVHYIPVSQGMEELAEVTFFFTSTRVGRQRARSIAEQGRRWAARALREVDMSVYLYRLLLELARLQDVERGARL